MADKNLHDVESFGTLTQKERCDTIFRYEMDLRASNDEGYRKSLGEALKVLWPEYMKCIIT
jgi:hypothetical protein